jgi:hypothetical protein
MPIFRPAPFLISLGPRQDDYQTLADMLNVGSV